MADNEKKSGFRGGTVYYSEAMPHGTDHKIDYSQADDDIFTNALNNWNNLEAMEPAILRLYGMGYLDSADVYSNGNQLKTNLESDKIRGAIRRWNINTHKDKMWESIKSLIPGFED